MLPTTVIFQPIPSLSDTLLKTQTPWLNNLVSFVIQSTLPSHSLHLRSLCHFGAFPRVSPLIVSEPLRNNFAVLLSHSSRSFTPSSTHMFTPRVSLRVWYEVLSLHLSHAIIQYYTTPIITSESEYDTSQPLLPLRYL